jgi:tRNA-splicing ligase RtcB
MPTADPRLVRTDPHRLRVENPQGVEAVLFAGEDVPVESAAVGELLGVLQVADTAERFADAQPEAFDVPPAIERVAVTPDFHKAAGIPVGTVLATRGFVVPQAVGNDINCGMRLHVTDLPAVAVAGRLDALETACRRLYFEAGRNIPMTRGMRQALLTAGLAGLADALPAYLHDGIWPLFRESDVGGNLDRVERRGSIPAGLSPGLDDFLGPADRTSRDGQIGSIGGGNHFVEVQRVERVLDGPTAHAWGLRPGLVTVMVHTGSVMVGHKCGGLYRDAVRALYPVSLRHPENGIFPLPAGGRHADTTRRFWDALHNAANFAFGNRLFLAMLAWAALREACGESDFRLLYDAPHNLVWPEEDADGVRYIHRKGATTARGFADMADTPFRYHGEPVLVPGSMGASSFILVGQGNPEALASASHGAGRVLSRGEALRGDDAEFRAFLERFRVVTPVDLRRQDVRARRDIVEKKLAEIKQEAPFAYKGIGPVVRTLEAAGIARPVAELTPLLTVKG